MGQTGRHVCAFSRDCGVIRNFLKFSIKIWLLLQDLTGVVPEELPESPTHPGKPMRRKVGTTFEFDESLLSVYHDMEVCLRFSI